MRSQLGDTIKTLFFILTGAIPVVLVTIFYSVIAALAMALRLGTGFYHRLMRGWSTLLLFFLRVGVEVRGLDHIDREKPYVFLANHSSYLDIIAIGRAIPGGALFVYREELTKVPIWGWSLRASPFIMISRSDARNAMRSIEKGAADIRTEGESVVIFPEGSRSADGGLTEFRRGGFLLAALSGVPLVPLALHGAGRLLPRGDWVVKPGRITVEIGRPHDLGVNPDRPALKSAQVELFEELHAMLDRGADA